jgi:hypothetical protein
MRAADRLATIACLLEQNGGTLEILPYDSAVTMEQAETGATFQCFTITCLPIQGGCACRIRRDTGSIVVHGTEADAARVDTGVARALKQLCGASFVTQHVLSLQQPERDGIARLCAAILTQLELLSGFAVSGIAAVQ